MGTPLDVRIAAFPRKEKTHRCPARQGRPGGGFALLEKKQEIPRCAALTRQITAIFPARTPALSVEIPQGRSPREASGEGPSSRQEDQTPAPWLRSLTGNPSGKGARPEHERGRPPGGGSALTLIPVREPRRAARLTGKGMAYEAWAGIRSRGNVRLILL